MTDKRLTRSKFHTDYNCHYTPTQRLRGGAEEYFIFYATHTGQGHAFTEAELTGASQRFVKLDQGDALFPHRWTFLRWFTSLFD